MEPIYRSDGEWVAVYHKGHIFNVDREWIGFVIGREVYDTDGMYLGFLSNDRRLLRKRARPPTRPRMKPPPRPVCPELPSRVPLAPMLRALPFQIIDLFETYPERLSYISETRPDME
ncbi:MAG: 4-fold beta flower protein [Anaerolineae bacterium]